MRTPIASRRGLLVPVVSLALGGCEGAAGGQGPDDGSAVVVDGSGGTDGAASGGASGGTPSGPLGAAGTSASGGTVALGGATGGALPAGGTAAGGVPAAGGASGGDGQVGTGAQPAGGTEGSGSTAGTTGTGGAPGIGGAAGAATGGVATTGGGPVTGGVDAAGGTDATGGTAGTGGAPGSGGQAGSAEGGTSQTGGATGTGGQSGDGERLISFGTLLDPQAVMTAAQQLAESVADPSSPQWRAKGDQHRTYSFAAASTEEPYRLCVPTAWDGASELPLVMFLHGAGSDENTYLDQNDQQMVRLAEEHGFLLVSPRGDQGAYGNFLRLTAPFGDEQAAADLMSQVTPDSERTNELSEQDVINVLELVLSEYPIDRSAMFLTGHSMGSGGTWYIGGKYPAYWRALAPMSGPFVQESGYPWDGLSSVSLFVTEGTQTPSLEASRRLRDWLLEHDFDAEYLEVNADHGGMVPLVLPDVFDFFDRSRAD